ncbi:MAG: M48 family metallopeptidase [Hyphomicrobiaceae bacterium]|nr:M48 family metallopeptidase [Hyphomicrobiaceae bacterium]
MSETAGFASEIVYSGQFSDGRTARTTNVDVRFAEHGIDLFKTQSGELLGGWPYEELESSVFVQTGEPAHLGNKTMLGARLFVPNNAGHRADFASELLVRVPHLSRKRANLQVVFWLTGAAVASVLAIIALNMMEFSPARSIAQMIPEQIRKGLGQQVIASLGRGKKACHSPAGDKAFGKILARLDQGTGKAGKFDVKVIPIGMMNAFAAPGEYIVVSKKLLDFVETPEELAGVIAHEMGHGEKMHPEAGVVRALGISAGISIAMGGSTGGLGDLGGLLLQLKYSRTAETEADTLALQTLKAAQIPAKPFAAFFARLEKEHGGLADLKKALEEAGEKSKKTSDKAKKDKKNKESGEKKTSAGGDGIWRALQLLSTHPSSPERIQMIKSQPKWKSAPLLSATEWQALRKICDSK